MGLQTGEPEAAPSPHRDLRDTPDPRPCPARAPKMTTTLVSATIFDLSEVLCKVKWGAAFPFKVFFLLSSKRISKSLGLDRQWWGRGREARWLFFPPHFSPRFEGIWLSPPHPLRFNHSWRGLPGNPEARVLGGAVCVGAARGSGWGWDDFSAILFARDVPLLSPASLVSSV